MATEYTHRIVLTISEGAPYGGARLAMSQVTREPSDAMATWRLATDGTTHLVTGEWVATHRVCNTLARARTVAALPMLQAQVGGTWHILESDRDTETLYLMTQEEALEAAGLWLLEEAVDEETLEPTGAYVRAER